MSGTLLHICCAPCSIACIDTLRQEGIEPVGFWYNPNIHPMKEYKMRKNTLVEYAKSIDLKLEIENEYGLRRFIEAVYPNWDNRCATCYALLPLMGGGGALVGGADLLDIGLRVLFAHPLEQEFQFVLHSLFPHSLTPPCFAVSAARRSRKYPPYPRKA